MTKVFKILLAGHVPEGHIETHFPAGMKSDEAVKVLFANRSFIARAPSSPLAHRCVALNPRDGLRLLCPEGMDCPVVLRCPSLPSNHVKVDPRLYDVKLDRAPSDSCEMRVRAIAFDECEKMKSGSLMACQSVGIGTEDMERMSGDSGSKTCELFLPNSATGTAGLGFKARLITAIKPGQIYVTADVLSRMVDNVCGATELVFPELSRVAHTVKIMPTFTQFLAQKGMRGLPAGLDASLLPALASRGRWKEFAAARGIMPEKGILFSGPPGTGKTTIALHLAEYLGCPPQNIQLVDATSLKEKWVGDGDKHVRRIFEQARSSDELSVIVIDELDGVAADRKNDSSNGHSEELLALLSQMDGLHAKGKVLVIGATNNIDRLDPAIKRPGRFGTVIHFQLPNYKERIEIFQTYLAGPAKRGLVDKDVDLRKLAHLTEGCSGADIRGVVERVNRSSMMRAIVKVREGKVPMDHIVVCDEGVMRGEDFINEIARHFDISTVTKDERRVKIPFRTFLQQHQMVGLPEELEAALVPIFASFGPLKGISDGIPKEKGILLAGPPGTGKTTLARLIGQYLGTPADRIHVLSASELLKSYRHASEEEIHKLFERARLAEERLGEDSPPCIILIDEIDSIGAVRTGKEPSAHVNALLSEMDGLRKIKNLLVIGTTNRLDILDPALKREGRFGTTVLLEPPAKEERIKIFKTYTQKMLKQGRIDSKINFEALGMVSEGMTGADIRGVIRTAQRSAFLRLVKLAQSEDLDAKTLLDRPESIVRMSDIRDSIASHFGVRSRL